MKNWPLLAFILFPFFSMTQDRTGDLALGTQFYQNVLLPENYEGLGVGLNLDLEVIYGIGIDAHYFYESNDLLNTGNLKRFQGGASIKYAPFYKRKLTPWIKLGIAFNTINVLPVSYLFVDNSSQGISQNYLSYNSGLGAQYNVNKNLTLNTGFYFQPQNYTPNYLLSTSDGENQLITNYEGENIIDVDPLLYFNIGFTYRITKLWNLEK